MNKLIKYRQLFIFSLLYINFFTSCNKLYDAKQELNPTESQLYKDEYEYRSAAMGLYALQQKLVEQLIVLGELRGDLLQITPNADADMVEIYNFNVSKNNKYASPVNFFKLISACNSFLRNVKKSHPDVTSPDKPIHVFYDNLYGEALCMRAWAYFNAVRIYGKVPYIPEELSTITQIEGYVNSPAIYKDSVFINFNIDGFHNDTIRKDTTFEKKYYDMPMIVDIFTSQLEKEIKYQGGTYGVGVNYAKVNNDPTWEIITWHPYSMFALLGQMYLTRGDYSKASVYFRKIISNSTVSDNNLLNNRYDLTNVGMWSNFFTSIDPQEHIFTIWFNKDYHQQNQLQDFFTNKIMMKPTKIAVSKWENCWHGQEISRNPNPELTTMRILGEPGDLIRGYYSSYICTNNSTILSPDKYSQMMKLRALGDIRGANAIMDGKDTLVYKYSMNKSQYSNDANYIIYRAASIHLYMAEIYVNWYENGKLAHTKIVGFLNQEITDGNKLQMGVRGRVGLGSGYDAVSFDNIIYMHDPYTNKISKPAKYTDYTENLTGKKQYLEDQILNERALELGFEGERFYDIMRIAKRRNNPSYLASIISAKYPSDKRQYIYNLLLNEKNWYINYFE